MFDRKKSDFGMENYFLGSWHKKLLYKLEIIFDFGMENYFLGSWHKKLLYKLEIIFDFGMEKCFLSFSSSLLIILLTKFNFKSEARGRRLSRFDGYPYKYTDHWD